MSPSVPPILPIFSVISLCLCLIVPIGLAVYGSKRNKVPVRIYFLGMAVFLLFGFLVGTLVNQIPAQMGTSSFWLLLLCSFFSLCVFPMLGLYLACRYWMKTASFSNALGLGTGYAMLPMIATGILRLGPSLVFMVAVNSGAGFLGWSPEKMNYYQTLVAHSSAASYLLVGLNELFFLGVSLFLTALIQRGVYKQRIFYLPLAILGNVLYQTPSVLYQYKVFPLWGKEGLLLLLTVSALFGLWILGKNWDSKIPFSQLPFQIKRKQRGSGRIKGFTKRQEH